MRRSYDDLRQAGAEVVLISFAQGEPLRAFARQMDLPFPVLSDPQRQAYRAYGLARGRWWNLIGPRTLWAYLGLTLRGRLWTWVTLLRRGQLGRGVVNDPYQLGGDFVIDARGTIRFAYRSSGPADRAPVGQLLEEVRGLAAAS